MDFGDAILTSERVVLARELAARGVPIKIIANQGMVAPATIAKAVRGRTWGWLS